MKFRTDKGKVSEFLQEFREIVSQTGLYVISRSQNQRDLSRLELDERTRKSEILGLSVEEYCSGPEPDKDKPGEVWIFGKMIGAREVYIKLKIAKGARKPRAICLSFHLARSRLSYPYK
jgi:hypothetical protein